MTCPTPTRAEQLQVHATVLRDLSRRGFWKLGDRAQAFAELCEVAARTLDVERVSIWLYDPARTKITCADLYERSLNRHTSGPVVTQAEHPSYFAALDEERSIAAHDARVDSRTQELGPEYLEPLGITSMLDAPILSGGKSVGVLCHEHVGPSRVWTPEEETFAATLGDFAAMTLEFEQRRALEEQLLQSQKMDGIGQLAGGIAHDFNNLLLVISGYSELLLFDRNLSEKQHESVRAIVDASKRAAELTRQILTFASRQPTRIRVVRVADLVEGMSGFLRRLLGETVQLKIRCSAPAAATRVDPNQLEQVLVNLCINARDAMKNAGTIWLDIDAVAIAGTEVDDVLSPGDYVSIQVTDEGQGIPADVLPRVLEPFFTTKPVGSGSGLGLSTCYGIVRQAGGDLRIDTEVGVGTTVRVYLPCTDEQPDVDDPVASDAVEARGNERLLVVEDELLVCGLTASILDRAGYEVSVATDAEQALAILEAANDEIQMVVTDVVLPGMSGVELMTEIHRTRPDMPALYLSGYSLDGQGKDRLQPTDEFLPKPFSPGQLTSRVRQVLDRQPS